ncbi:hypothetical protein OAG71_03440, partial [bacterium]|nr:hypothetical protein [bacterium]
DEFAGTTDNNGVIISQLVFDGTLTVVVSNPFAVDSDGNLTGIGVTSAFDPIAIQTLENGILRNVTGLFLVDIGPRGETTFTFDVGENFDGVYIIRANTFVVGGIGNSRIVSSLGNPNFRLPTDGAPFGAAGAAVDGATVDAVVDTVRANSVSFTFHPGINEAITQVGNLFVVLDNLSVHTLLPGSARIDANPINNEVTFTYSIPTRIYTQIELGANSVLGALPYDVVIPNGAFTFQDVTNLNRVISSNGLTRYRKEGVTTLPLPGGVDPIANPAPLSEFTSTPRNFAFAGTNTFVGDNDAANEVSVRGAFGSDFYFDGTTFDPTPVLENVPVTIVRRSDGQSIVLGSVRIFSSLELGVAGIGTGDTIFRFEFQDGPSFDETFDLVFAAGTFQANGFLNSFFTAQIPG